MTCNALHQFGGQLSECCNTKLIEGSENKEIQVVESLNHMWTPVCIYFFICKFFFVTPHLNKTKHAFHSYAAKKAVVSKIFELNRIRVILAPRAAVGYISSLKV